MTQLQDSGWVFNKLPTDTEFKDAVKLKQLKTSIAEVTLDLFIGYVELDKNTVNMIREAIGGCIYPTTIGLDIFIEKEFDAIKLAWTENPAKEQFHVTIDMDTPARIPSLALKQNFSPEKYRLFELSSDFTWAIFKNVRKQ